MYIVIIIIIIIIITVLYMKTDIRARKCYSEAGCLLDTAYVYSSSADIF